MAKLTKRKNGIYGYTVYIRKGQAEMVQHALDALVQSDPFTSASGQWCIALIERAKRLKEVDLEKSKGG